MLVQQGRRLNAAGRQAEALELYDRALKINPDQFEAHLASGIALDLLARYDGSPQPSVARDPACARRRQTAGADGDGRVLGLPEANRRRGESSTSRCSTETSPPGRHADAAEAANALGRLYLETGDYRGARRWYETGYEQARRQPEEPGSQLTLWKFRWLHAQARIAAREGKPTDSHPPRDPRARGVVEGASGGRTGRRLPRRLCRLVPEEAEGRAHGAGQADQDDPFILMLMARAHEQLKQRAAARQTWERVLTLNGHSLQNALARPAARAALHD